VEERWVKVAVAPNETLALLMDGLLQSGGVPSLIQRAPGFDVPDFLSAGPRDVLVPGAYLEEARQILEDTTGLGSYVP
jgi:predicted esterase